MTGDRPIESRCVLFVDCDRFYFAVEAAENPALATDPRPIAISHDPRVAPRAVITTANDAARTLGISSAMSAGAALRIAPDLVFLPPRHDLYWRYSSRVMAIVREASPLVQQNSVDEAACVWPAGLVAGPALALRQRVLAEAGISISMGLATSPLVAKMASEIGKRRSDHLCIVPPGTEVDFLAPMDIRALIGVGPKAEQRLRAYGIETIGTLAARPRDELIALFGRAYGQYLHDASRGIDDSELAAERMSKSISAEQTFGTDTTDRALLWRTIRAQAEEVAQRLTGEGVRTREVGIKLRYADWETHTRQTRLEAPTDDAAAIAASAAELMRRHWDRQRAVRLIGVRAGKLTTDDVYVQLRLPIAAEPPSYLGRA